VLRRLPPAPDRQLRLEGRRSVPPSAAIVALLGGLGVLALLHVTRGLDYWDYSEGVYALTSRLFLRGGDLYGHIVTAQPPWQYLWPLLGIGAVTAPRAAVHTPAAECAMSRL
jgi:hypothetical protein